MKKNVVFILFSLLVFAGTDVSRAQCKKSADKPTCAQSTESVAVQAAGPAAPAEPKIPKELDKLLDKVEAAGAKLKSFQAGMVYQLDQPLIDTREIRNGRLYYLADKETVRFRIHFSDWQQIDLMEEELMPVVSLDLDYGFDGLWFTKRDARNKNVQMWEIGKKPKPREYFRLGRGPFPLPLAIKKSDVIKSSCATHLKYLPFES